MHFLIYASLLQILFSCEISLSMGLLLSNMDQGKNVMKESPRIKIQAVKFGRRLNDNRSFKINGNVLNDNDDERPAETQKQPRIVGGKPTINGRYPYLATILRTTVENENYGVVICGGTLIAPDVVLTAAHCTTDTPISRLVVYLGAYDVSQNYEKNPNLESFHVIRKRKHPDYHEKVYYENDAVLLQLSKETELHEPLSIIGNRLNENVNEDKFLRKSKLVVVGFGATVFSASNKYAPYDIARHANVTYLQRNECKGVYHNRFTDSMICAHGKGKRDACNGDSGGPLILSSNDSVNDHSHSGTSDILVGIISWGFGCASPDYPGVYTRVSVIHSWILETVCKFSPFLKGCNDDDFGGSGEKQAQDDDHEMNFQTTNALLETAAGNFDKVPLSTATPTTISPPRDSSASPIAAPTTLPTNLFSQNPSLHTSQSPTTANSINRSTLKLTPNSSDKPSYVLKDVEAMLAPSNNIPSGKSPTLSTLIPSSNSASRNFTTSYLPFQHDTIPTMITSIHSSNDIEYSNNVLPIREMSPTESSQLLPPPSQEQQPYLPTHAFTAPSPSIAAGASHKSNDDAVPTAKGTSANPLPMSTLESVVVPSYNSPSVSINTEDNLSITSPARQRLLGWHSTTLMLSYFSFAWALLFQGISSL